MESITRRAERKGQTVSAEVRRALVKEFGEKEEADGSGIGAKGK